MIPGKFLSKMIPHCNKLAFTSALTQNDQRMNVSSEIEAVKWSMTKGGGYNFANYILLLKLGWKQKHRRADWVLWRRNRNATLHFSSAPINASRTPAAKSDCDVEKTCSSAPKLQIRSLKNWCRCASVCDLVDRIEVEVLEIGVRKGFSRSSHGTPNKQIQIAST